jgi:hypothetical protein
VLTDLSGRYFGRLEYPAAGLSGVGTLIIRANRFEITIESTTLTGRISTAAGDRFISVVLHFDRPPVGSTTSTLTLKGVREGRDIWLFIRDIREFSSEGPSEFYFGTRPPQSGGRDPASVNTNANTTATNTNANTSANSNRPDLPATVGGPDFPDIRPATRAPRPRQGTRATGGMEPSANANVAASPAASASNTNSSFSSQLRGEANVGFQVPETMRLDETKTIELVVSPTESVESIKKGLEEEGRTETSTTRYSDRMEAKLVGTGFTITPAGPDIQPVEPGQLTRWKWQIQPKAGGIQRLDLTLNAIVNDGKDRKLISALKREIQIKVTWGQRASTFVGALKDIHWLWGALIVPIAGAIYAWWRKKGAKRPKKKRSKTKS